MYAFRPYYLVWMIGGFENERISDTDFQKYKTGFLLEFFWKLVLVSSMYGVGVIIFFGLEAVFEWMSDDWGSVKEGEWLTYRSSLSALISFCSTILLFGYLLYALSVRHEYCKMETLAKGYEEILYAINLNNPLELNSLAQQYHDKADEFNNKRDHWFNEKEHFLRQAQYYSNLARHAEEISDHLDKWLEKRNGEN